MKAFVLSLGALLMVVGATGARAQQSPATSPDPAPSDRSANPAASPGASAERPGNVDVKPDTKALDQAPADRRPDVNVNVEKKDQPASPDRNDGGSALPRSAANDRTTVLGLNPAAAIVIAAALLVVVILAIVAMTRSGDTTYIDRERRL
jgi:hypothetical protein